MTRYKRAIYSAEQYKFWKESSRRRAMFFDAHSHITEKVFEVSGHYIRCIQRKYDTCLNKENQYGVQVWETKEYNNPDNCLANEWFNTPEEANGRFLFWKANCEG